MVLQVGLQTGLGDFGCVGGALSGLEHIGTFSGNSLHPGLHQGVKDLYVLLGVDHLCPISKKWGSMTSPLLEVTPRTMTEADNFVLLSGRSEICLPNILVLAQNCL